MGTYKGTGTQVIVKERDNVLEIHGADGEPICTHRVSSGKGRTIVNTDHKRDRSKSLDQMKLQATSFFTDGAMALEYLQKIDRRLPRYTRDHLQVIIRALGRSDGEAADRALEFCLKNDILNGHDFENVLFLGSPGAEPAKREIRLLDRNNLEKADQVPEKSDLRDYGSIFNQ